MSDGIATVPEAKSTGNARYCLSNGSGSHVFAPSQIRDSIGLRENCRAAVQDFLIAAAEGRSAPIPGEIGIGMIVLEEAIFRSAESGSWEFVE